MSKSRPLSADFKPTISMANTTGDPGAPFDLVVLGGFESEEAARQFGERLLVLGLAELPVPFVRANSRRVM